MVDPATAMMIATIVSSAAKGAGGFLGNKKAEKANKRRAHEQKRETIASLLNDAMQGSAENATHHLNSRSQLAKKKTQSSQNTADLVRGAFNI